MFAAIPSDNFGLNIDPSHLVWLQIDYERAVYDYGSTGSSTRTPRTSSCAATGCTGTARSRAGSAGRCRGCPGLGEVDWGRFIAALYAVGYDHVLSIEHEDRVRGRRGARKRGFLLARDVLQPRIV